MKRGVGWFFLLPCLVACGGKVVFEEAASGSGGASSTGSVTSGASGSVTSASTGTGGCDPAKHTIDPAEFDTTCAVPSDCVTVFTGNLCGNCQCPNTSISAIDQAQYDAERAAKQYPLGPGGCFCPAALPDCTAGHCTVKLP